MHRNRVRDDLPRVPADARREQRGRDSVVLLPGVTQRGDAWTGPAPSAVACAREERRVGATCGADGVQEGRAHTMALGPTGGV
ncbi:hypothetical protein NM688_g7177 [Phlebia brevispora]|uniref:Uncharacterized protein n=1 Tax=Phlebia brevispora TaxID=194682 RepID=A0ACC1S8S2_9APHY|nr:hypothetical protein NM688_g7177 [Phlebia brevispora]